MCQGRGLDYKEIYTQIYLRLFNWDEGGYSIFEVLLFLFYSVLCPTENNWICKTTPTLWLYCGIYRFPEHDWNCESLIIKPLKIFFNLLREHFSSLWGSDIWYETQFWTWLPTLLLLHWAAVTHMSQSHQNLGENSSPLPFLLSTQTIGARQNQFQ